MKTGDKKTAMPGALTTIDEARDYATSIACLRRLPVHIFPVPEGTRAYEYGFRFGTCPDDERAAYESDGAKIIETVNP
jgi:hypothetical protein